MEFLLAFLMSLFGAQADSPGQMKNARSIQKAPKGKVVTVTTNSVERPDPNQGHGPIIIIDDTHYRPVQQ